MSKLTTVGLTRIAALFAVAKPAFALDKTVYSETFDGCDFARTSELKDGRTLPCRGYGYHYAYASDVIVMDGFAVLIDVQEFSASID